MAWPNPRDAFLTALADYVTVRIEQHERHGQTVPHETVNRWEVVKLKLSLALDRLMEGD